MMRSLLLAATTVLLLAASNGLAQTPAEAPTWAVSAGTDPFSRAGQGAAYVEASSHPADLEQIATGLFVACPVR